MKIIKSFHLFSLGLFSLGFLIAFSSCGSDDNPTNPGTPSGTVLFAKDSIAVWLTAGSSFATDTIAFTTSETGSVKVEFQLQSNADSSEAAGYYDFNTNASPPYPITREIYAPVDSLCPYNFSFASPTTYFGFAVKLTTHTITQPYYVRLKNIKITKL